VASSSSEWSLFSNSGRERFSGSFIKRGLSEDGLELVLGNAFVAGQFWLEPSFAASDGRAGQALEPAFSVLLPNIVFRKDRIELLLAELERWLLWS
jgi:hypothetical protein